MRKVFFPIIIFFVLLGAYMIIKDKPLLIDEVQHYSSIIEISQGEITDKIILRDAKFPGYVLLMGTIGAVLKNPSIPVIRLINTFFSFLCLRVFYLIAKKISPENAKVKTLQFLFLPILFVFFFLIYTDVLSLLALLSAYYFLIKGRYQLSGLSGILSVLVRQNNILWIGFFLVYLLINQKSLTAYLKNAWVYLLSLMIFLLFLILNQGASFGITNKLSQPISLHFGNIFFLLFLFFFLFLPQNLNNVSKIFTKIKNHPKSLALLILFFVFYWLTYKVDHLWNGPNFNFFLRNKILNYSVSGLLEKLLFFLPIGYAFLSLFIIQLRKKVYYLLYPFTIIFLSLSWLIEQRYYLIPLSLFILFKTELTPRIEFLNLLFFIAVSTLLFFGIANGLFFL